MARLIESIAPSMTFLSEENKMNKQQLKQLIKEEITQILSEQSLLDLDDYKILEDSVNKLIDSGYTKEDVAQAFASMMETM